MRRSRSVLVLGATLGLALAACSGAASPSPAAVTSPSATSASPSPSPASAFSQAGQKANPGTTVSDASMSGKSVKKVVDPSETKPTYVYAHGDVMFFVQADSDALLNEVFSKLP